jgi:putative transposase
MHWVRIGGRFGTERAHGSGLPPVPLSHLRQAVQRAECGSLSRTQYPSDVIALVVLWRLRYKLALRDRPEMFLIRGIVFSHEAVRDWEAKLAPALAESLRRRRRGKAGCSWYIDET